MAGKSPVKAGKQPTKTEYKYIHFVKVIENHKTDVWECRHNTIKGVLGILGEIKWANGWRQYCFCPEYGTEFNNTCLADIIHFLGQLK